MKYQKLSCLILALLSIVSGSAALGASAPLSGNDHTGYLSLSNVKAFAAEPSTISYPYFQQGGIWQTIAAEPLSSASVYAEESSQVVLNKDVTDADFGQTDLGSISFADGLLTGAGTEVISPQNLSISLSAANFSPISNGHNSGTGVGDFGWDYLITAAGLSGNGLTFVNGHLASIDLVANVSVLPRFGGLSAGAFGSD